MSDDEQITIKTNARFYGRSAVKEPCMTFESLQSALLEAYRQANEIGWETKALDAFSSWVYNARQSVDGL